MGSAGHSIPELIRRETQLLTNSIIRQCKKRKKKKKTKASPLIRVGLG